MHEANYYLHETTIGRLNSILMNGLLAPNYSKKFGVKGYRRNFKSSWADDFVSILVNTSVREVTSPHVALLVNTSTLILKKPKYTKEDSNRTVLNELLIKDRILPINFLGIVIGEVGYSFKLEKAVKPKHISFKKVIKIAEESKTNLPIYFKGKQIWPTEE